MIIGCPQCQRKYRLTEEFAGKMVRCVCSAILKVPGGEEVVPEASSAPAPPPPPPAPSSEAEQAPEKELTWLEKIVYPNLTSLIDLSQFGDATEEEPELPDMEDMPDFDDEIPDFDEEGEDLTEGSEDIEDNIPDMMPDEEEEDTQARQDSLGGIKVEKDEFKMDPRVPQLLEAMAASEDPQFIVDGLFYLLEVKDFEIEGAVKKFVDNDNPLAAYYAKRILDDFAKMRGDGGKKPEAIQPFNVTRLMKNFFNGAEPVQKQQVEYAVNNREFSAVPYFITQLLKEKNINVICQILSRGSLLADHLEVEFIAHFMKNENQKIRLACIEGLSGINGDDVTQHLIAGLMDRDVTVVNAIKDALRSSDKDEVAAQILVYLRDNEVPDKQGYIKILEDYKNVNGFRALVWMFDDPMIRNDALEASKNFDLPPDVKLPVYEEYLLLSYEDQAFPNSVIDYVESLNPNYDRSRLIPVSQFDDSYVGLVRLSPLFAMDFAEDNEEDEQDATEEIEIVAFDFKRALFKPAMKIKEALGSIGTVASSKANIPFVAGQLLSYGLLIFFAFTSFIKGFGSGNALLPTNLIPKKFSADIGAEILTDPILGEGFATLSVVFVTVLAIAWLLGSSLALSQLRKNNPKVKFLAALPAILSSLIPAYSFGVFAHLQPNLLPTSLLITILLVFPCISIFYLLYLRMFQVVPRAQVECAMQLGASPDQAFTTVYAPIYHIATIFGFLFGGLYIFSSIQLTHFIPSSQSLGYSVFLRMEFGEIWLQLGFLGLLIGVPLFLALITLESLVPMFSLLPGGDKHEGSHPYYDHVKSWLALAGFLFYSRFAASSTKPKKATPPKKEKKEEEKETPDKKKKSKKKEEEKKPAKKKKKKKKK